MKTLLKTSFYFLVIAFLNACNTDFNGYYFESLTDIPSSDTYNEKYKDYEENPFIKVSE